jgi:hypothetical protein
MGALVGATEGVMKAVKEDTGAAVPLGAAAAGVLLGEGNAAAGVPLAVGVPDGVSVPVADAGAGAGVGESVPVAEAPAGAGVEEAVAEASAPGAGSDACHTPPHAMYCDGQAVAPLCWQHVKRGCCALRGLKCTRYVWRESYMPPTGLQGGESQQEAPGPMEYARLASSAGGSVLPPRMTGHCGRK